VSELYLQGFKAGVKVPGKELYAYPVEGASVLEVRGLLNSEEIPSAIVRVEDRLYVVTPMESKNLKQSPVVVNLERYASGTRQYTLYPFLEDFGAKIHDKLNTVIFPQLATSAVRLRLKRDGWYPEGSKLFNPKRGERIFEGPQVYRYEALRLSVHCYEHTGGYLFSVDPSFKLDTHIALNELSEDIRARLPTVKVCGGHFSFELLGIEKSGEEDLARLAKNTLEALKELDSRVEERGFGGVARVYPRSLRLREFLSSRNLLVKGERGVCYAYLSLGSLRPLPSLENLKLVGVNLTKYPMWLTPQKRYELVRDFIKDVEEIEVNGLEFKVLSKELTRVAYAELRPTAKTANGSEVGLDSIVERGSWLAEEDGKAAITPIRSGKKLRVALVNTHPEVSGRVLRELQSSLNQTLKGITSGAAEVITAKSLDDTLTSSEFNGVICVGRGDEREYADFEYEVASRGLIPQYIDGDKMLSLIEESEKKKRRFNPRFYAFPIAKSIAFRAGWRYVRLDPPPALVRTPIAGVDKTFVRVQRGVNLGMVPVLMEPSGLDVTYLDPVLGDNEEKVFVEAVSRLKRVLRDERSIMLCINRAYIPDVLVDELEKSFSEGFICASVTKTHNLSRLLKKGKSDRYVNPTTGAYCVLREERYHGVYLVAASDLKGKDDRTIRPVLVNIEVKGLRVAARDVLKYLFDMNVLNIESPYFPASLPWPLHQADRLCKKIYSISTYVHQIPSGSVLKLL